MKILVEPNHPVSVAKMQCVSERRRSKLADILLRVGLRDGGAGEGPPALPQLSRGTSAYASAVSVPYLLTIRETLDA